MSEWEPIEGYEGFYEISNTGIARSITRVITRGDGTKQTFQQRNLNSCKNSAGYVLVRLQKKMAKERWLACIGLLRRLLFLTLIMELLENC